jgi:hypothetical protein
MKERKEIEAQARALEKERAKSSKRGRIGLDPPKASSVPPSMLPPPLPADLDDDSMDRRDRRGPPSTNRDRSKSSDKGVSQGLGPPPGQERPQDNDSYDSGGYLMTHMQQHDQRRPVVQNINTGDDITEGE